MQKIQSSNHKVETRKSRGEMTRIQNNSTLKKNYTVLIIDDDSFRITLALIRSLGIVPNLKLHLLSLTDAKFPSFRFSKFVKSYTFCKVTDDDHAFSIIEKVCMKLMADIIVPVKEKTTRIIAERYGNCQKFTLIPPMPNPTVLKTVRNKWILYNWLYNRNLMISKPVLLKDLLYGNEQIEMQNFPLLLKPIWGSGGKGIMLIEKQSDISDLRFNKTINHQEYLVQPFIKGFDIDISVLSVNGEIITYIIQKGIAQDKEFRYSKLIEFINDDNLYELTKVILKDLRYSGIAHLDFRYDVLNKKYILIDFNARYWSTLLGALQCGINFPKLAIEKTLNNNIQEVDYKYCRYYSTNNILKIWKRHIPLKNSDFWFNLRDPLPFLLETIRMFTRRTNGIN